ncbi:hypothetical protein QR680_002641 [Steinernema hermaphroditum]|uniref:Tyrosinase copper-binding domain-containing protein n=1 Tax=Steinernema hermaphroditum TaxID=289476 RepID=A0AA39H653_9BILA|nr:hypothetical protein QR680_002641 [Steinernema hermaphroditum]
MFNDAKCPSADRNIPRSKKRCSSRFTADSYVYLDASVMMNSELKAYSNHRTCKRCPFLSTDSVRHPLPMALSSFLPRFSCLLFSILLISFDIVTAKLPNSAAIDCEQLHHSQFLSIQELDRACLHRSHWLKDLEARRSTEFLQKMTDSQRAYLSNLESCIGEKCRTNCESAHEKYGINCYRVRREILRPNPLRPKSIRKEYRMLSDEERENLNKAMNNLKQKMIDNVTAWDLHTLIHYPDSAPGAHWGPAFLPWHREFLRQFEQALQNEVPGVSLPYWDSTLDNGLPDPSDSVMWTDELLGNGNGYVKTGPFKNWDTNVFMPLSPVPVKKLYRTAGSRQQDRLLTERDLQWIESRSNYSELTFCHDKTFESMHGLSHVWVGGFMFVIRVSPNDPTFYMHHSFVDYVWERFRQKQQTREQRQNDWAKNTCNERHAPEAQMKPFKLRNIDGLSNDYIDFWYEYEPVRHCTKEKSYCDSKYLFCDKEAWRCRAKVMIGGLCKGFDNTDICYNSQCIENVCRFVNGTSPSPQLQTLPHLTEMVWAKTLLLSDGDLPLSSDLASVTVVGHRNVTVHMQKNVQYPEIPGIVYLPLPKPSAAISHKVYLEAKDHYGRYCQSYCRNDTIGKYQVCLPELTLKMRLDDKASNISFTHSFLSKKFLDVDLSSHPRHWLIQPPFMIFACHRKLVKSQNIMDLANEIKPSISHDDYVWFRVIVARRPGSDIDIENSVVEVSDLDDSSDVWTSSVRRAQSAYDPNVIIVRARNPMVVRRGVSVQISFKSSNRRIQCPAKCTKDSGVVDDCDGIVFLHADAERSEEKIFNADQSILQLLGWKMLGHPSQWTLRLPYLSFYC